MHQFFLGFLLIMVLLLIFFRTPVGKGIWGEARVRHTVGRTKPGKRYVVNNLRMTGETGRSAQIDHIVINRNGVFVIETKNYSGRIYGDDYGWKWTQVLKHGRVQNHFYSPVKQNATHVQNVRALIHTRVPVVSVVIFVKGNIRWIQSEHVYKRSRLRRVLARRQGTRLDVRTMERIYDILTEVKKTNTVTI